MGSCWMSFNVIIHKLITNNRDVWDLTDVLLITGLWKINEIWSSPWRPYFAQRSHSWGFFTRSGVFREGLGFGGFFAKNWDFLNTTGVFFPKKDEIWCFLLKKGKKTLPTAAAAGRRRGRRERPQAAAAGQPAWHPPGHLKENCARRRGVGSFNLRTWSFMIQPLSNYFSNTPPWPLCLPF